MDDVFRVGGRAYNVNIVSLEENFTILYSENTGRTMDNGKMFLDAIGTFYGHKVTVKRKNGYEREFDDLYNYISKPRNTGIQIDIVHNQEMISYEAYISNGIRKLERISKDKSKVFWGELSINIVPIEAQETL